MEQVPTEVRRITEQSMQVRTKIDSYLQFFQRTIPANVMGGNKLSDKGLTLHATSRNPFRVRPKARFRLRTSRSLSQAADRDHPVAEQGDDEQVNDLRRPPRKR